MGKALMIGAGGVAGVVAHKCCQNPEVFQELCIASRTLSKCDALKKKLDGGKTKVTTAQLNADNTEEIIALIETFKPDIVINVALPYQDLTIMDACLATKVHYLDTATMSHPILQSLSINGSGLIRKSLKKPALPLFWAVDLTQVLQASFPHTHKNIILMKFIPLIL